MLNHRIKESNFLWLNTNMRDIPIHDEIAHMLPEIHEVEIVNENHVRRVCFLGLLTEEPSLYLKGAFGGATISSVNETAKLYYEKLTASGRYDLIIPLTHQSIALDRRLLDEVPFPIVLGAHDHEVFDEVYNECSIIKTGMDGENIGLTEIIWESHTCSTPQIKTILRPSHEYPPDEALQTIVQKHLAVLENLHQLFLFKIPSKPWLPPFSSVMSRYAPSPVAILFANIIRDAMEADCCLLNAGNIRGKKNYTSAGQTVRFFSVFIFSFLI
jgi:2',3'-cyclic-nucleotide 2'-phosphodiesterase (5'-nucleotidase family)